MSFSSRRKKVEHIINEVSNEYKEASFWLPFDAVEIKDVFTKEELEIFQEFIDEIEESTSENERKAKLISNITKYSGVVLKGLKMAKIL